MSRIATAIICLGLTGLPLAARATANDADLRSLLDNSPFGAAQSSTGPTRTDTPVEFRGVFAEGGENFFNLYLAANSRSEWLGLGETYGDTLTVKAYDAANQQLTVELQGRPLTLSLGSAKRPAIAPTPAAPALTATTTPSAQPTAPVPDQERLAKIADEIRRRRALRQQALQKTAQ
ncbi:MAG: VCBS domain-containing protein [Opitutaceae bacterium]|nr:VCBS domain-containing protein [Opitutaceae bacterium]